MKFFCLGKIKNPDWPVFFKRDEYCLGKAYSVFFLYIVIAAGFRGIKQKRFIGPYPEETFLAFNIIENILIARNRIADGCDRTALRNIKFPFFLRPFDIARKAVVVFDFYDEFG